MARWTSSDSGPNSDGKSRPTRAVRLSTAAITLKTTKPVRQFPGDRQGRLLSVETDDRKLIDLRPWQGLFDLSLEASGEAWTCIADLVQIARYGGFRDSRTRPWLCAARRHIALPRVSPAGPRSRRSASFPPPGRSRCRFLHPSWRSVLSVLSVPLPTAAPPFESLAADISRSQVGYQTSLQPAQSNTSPGKTSRNDSKSGRQPALMKATKNNGYGRRPT